MQKFEYRVLVVERYEVRRCWADEVSAGQEVVGEFESEEAAREVIDALEAVEWRNDPDAGLPGNQTPLDAG